MGNGTHAAGLGYSANAEYLRLMKKIATNFFLLGIFISTFSCQKDHHSAPTGPTTTPPTTVLYIGGNLTSGAGVLQAAYWKFNLAASGTPAPTTTLPVTLTGANLVNMILVSDTDVYLAANTTDGVGRYWKNDTAVPVSDAKSLSYIMVSGSNVYATGINSSDALAYWVNQRETSLAATLPSGGATYSPTGITVSGSDVYLTGNLSFIPRPGLDTVAYGAAAGYWKDGQLSLLTEGTAGGLYYPSTTGIIASGPNVYVSGNELTTSDVVWAGYWKDGNPTTLVSSEYLQTRSYTNTTGIAVSGSDVYVTGVVITVDTLTDQASYQAIYWKNGIQTSLPSGAQASGITINGQDVYIVGTDASNEPMVWKNGEILLKLNAGSIQPNCIAVLDK